MAVCLSVDALPPAGTSLLRLDRRKGDSRERLLSRVRSEFSEMPCLRLTEPQSRRLFCLREDICRRVMAALVDEGVLSQGPDTRYGVRASH